MPKEWKQALQKLLADKQATEGHLSEQIKADHPVPKMGLENSRIGDVTCVYHRKIYRHPHFHMHRNLKENWSKRQKSKESSLG